MRDLDVVVGGMYGSEAKGHTVQRLVYKRMREHGHVANVRIGGPNAGHCAFDKKGRKWALRQVPVGVVLQTGAGRTISLMIAPGSEVDPEVLKEEITELTKAGLLGGRSGKTLRVHCEATIIDPEHKEMESGLVGSIGSTGKGIGAARAARVMRKARRVGDDPDLIKWLHDRGVEVSWGLANEHIPTVVEGTQGYALGLRAGYYPHTTSADCTAIDFLSKAHINPWDRWHLTVWVVARVYPIRVAGNSGPMARETSWDELGLEPERTTVTKKVRRVGEPDWELLRDALLANGANGSDRVQIALSMVDHMFPEVANIPWGLNDPRWRDAEDFIVSIEELVGSRVGLVMSGPNTGAFR